MSHVRSRLSDLRGIAQLLLLATSVLAACKGPNEQGRKGDQDKAVPQTSGWAKHRAEQMQRRKAVSCRRWN